MLKRINLVPKTPFHVRLKRWGIAFSFILIVLGIALPLTSYLMLRAETRDLRRLVQELEKEASIVEAMNIKVNSLQKDIEHIKGKIKGYEAEISTLGRKRRIVPDFKGALLALSYSINDDTRLEEVALDARGGTLKGEVKKVEAMPFFLESIKRAKGPIGDPELLELSKERLPNSTIYKFKVRVKMVTKEKQ